MIKQHLRLAKEIQCRDFDDLIGHTSIVFMCLNTLGIVKNRTIGFSANPESLVRYLESCGYP